jgi:hypothetical protein
MTQSGFSAARIIVILCELPGYPRWAATVSTKFAITGEELSVRQTAAVRILGSCYPTIRAPTTLR